MKEKLKDVIEAAPEITQAHWDELGTLLRRHTCIQAFVRNMLVIAQDRADQLANISVATEESREQNALGRGAFQALQSYVAAACGMMGDTYEEEMEALAEVEEEENPTTTTRRRRKPAPKKKQLRKRKS